MTGYLAHEVGDHAVEGGALVAEPLLPGAESSEVLAGLGSHVGPQLHDEATQGAGVSRHVEVNPGGHIVLSAARTLQTGVLLTEFVEPYHGVRESER